MIAGVSWAWWVGFHAVVAAVLLADSFLPGHRRTSRYAQAFVWVGTAGVVLAAAGFACWIAVAQGRQPALEFAAGYSDRGVAEHRQPICVSGAVSGVPDRPAAPAQGPNVGCVGRVCVAGAFIAAGITLLQRFEWVTWVFGLFLLYMAWRLVRGGSARAAIPEWIVRLQPAKGSLLPVILAVEVTDLLFATDSIPAVLSITHNPFVAYTSNVAAILGLRSIYFALAGMLERFRNLHYGLGAILAFAALKMLAARWIEVPATISLVVIGGILAVCAVASAVGQQISKTASQKDGGSAG